MTIRMHHLALAGVLIVAGGVLVRGHFAHGGVPFVAPSCPAELRNDPDVLFCDDFEDSSFQSRWDVTSRGNRWAHEDFIQCSDHTFGFRSGCAAWTNNLVFDGSWGYWGYSAKTLFPPASEFHVRWYQYISNPFVWGSLEDKSLIARDQAETIIAYVGTSRNHRPVEANSGPGMPFVANYQDFDWDDTGRQYSKVNRFQNQGHNITLEPGKWYLFEWYVKLNSPGIADGITKLWVDDATEPIHAQTLRLHYTDMRWLKSSDAGKQFGEMQLTVYDQRCDGTPNTCPPNGPDVLTQSHRWDDLVVSRHPVGPLTEQRTSSHDHPR